MDIKLTILILQVLVCTVYISYIKYRFGELPSISESAYLLGKGRGLFWLFCILLGILQAMEGSILYFLSGAGLVFTGTTLYFKIDHVGRVHFIATILAVVFMFFQHIVVDIIAYGGLIWFAGIIICWKLWKKGSSTMVFDMEIVAIICALLAKLYIWLDIPFVPM